MGCPASSVPSAYRAQLATTAADRATGPPVARLCRMTGSSHFGMRSELAAHRRASVSRTASFPNLSMRVSM